MIEDLAAQGNVVIVGRGSSLILADNPAVLDNARNRVLAATRQAGIAFLNQDRRQRLGPVLLDLVTDNFYTPPVRNFFSMARHAGDSQSIVDPAVSSQELGYAFHVPGRTR